MTTMTDQPFTVRQDRRYIRATSQSERFVAGLFPLDDFDQQHLLDG